MHEITPEYYLRWKEYKPQLEKLLSEESKRAESLRSAENKISHLQDHHLQDLISYNHGLKAINVLRNDYETGGMTYGHAELYCNAARAAAKAIPLAKERAAGYFSAGSIEKSIGEFSRGVKEKRQERKKQARHTRVQDDRLLGEIFLACRTYKTVAGFEHNLYPRNFYPNQFYTELASLASLADEKKAGAYLQRLFEVKSVTALESLAMDYLQHRTEQNEGQRRLREKWKRGYFRGMLPCGSEELLQAEPIAAFRNFERSLQELQEVGKEKVREYFSLREDIEAGIGAIKEITGFAHSYVNGSAGKDNFPEAGPILDLSRIQTIQNKAPQGMPCYLRHHMERYKAAAEPLKNALHALLEHLQKTAPGNAVTSQNPLQRIEKEEALIAWTERQYGILNKKSILEYNDYLLQPLRDMFQRLRQYYGEGKQSKAAGIAITAEAIARGETVTGERVAGKAVTGEVKIGKERGENTTMQSASGQVHLPILPIRHIDIPTREDSTENPTEISTGISAEKLFFYFCRWQEQVHDPQLKKLCVLAAGIDVQNGKKAVWDPRSWKERQEEAIFSAKSMNPDGLEEEERKVLNYLSTCLSRSS